MLDDFYDEIWVYGHKDMGNPLRGVGLPEAILDRLVFTGYIMRHVPTASHREWQVPAAPYLLVTSGGGGDGHDLVDWVLRAYESGAPIRYPALVVLGPFMPIRERHDFIRRIERLDNVTARTFSPIMELLMERAAGVVAMGGYNTFCEIISFDKRALLVPRSTPRREQLLRVERAGAPGLVRFWTATALAIPRRWWMRSMRWPISRCPPPPASAACSAGWRTSTPAFSTSSTVPAQRRQRPVPAPFDPVPRPAPARQRARAAGATDRRGTGPARRRGGRGVRRHAGGRTVHSRCRARAAAAGEEPGNGLQRTPGRRRPARDARAVPPPAPHARGHVASPAPAGARVRVLPVRPSAIP
ncbi:MAG: hypothetical protein M5U09_24190 [Gammaproteobacteria bacterium]|nr:hypothetical protein [Gammaproteobacteria bacterium]